MSATLCFNGIEVRPIGNKVTVPDNDIARLMYYLSCVHTVINYDSKDMFTDYEHYYLLTGNERIELMALVSLFNPNLFVEAGIFIIDDNLVPEGSSNEFYEITDHKIAFHVNEGIMIGGKYVKVRKIMACKTDWLYRNFINPLNNITKSLKETDTQRNEERIKTQRTIERRKKRDESCCSIY